MNRKRIVIITIFFVITIFLVLLYHNRITNLSINRVDGLVQFFESMDDSNNLYGITKNGDIYCFNYSNLAELIKEQTDIIFYKSNSNISLIIHMDGSIYLDEAGGFEGKLIGKIEGAVKGDTSTIHTAIVTNKGQLFMYGDNMYGDDEYNILGTGDINKLEEFREISLPNDVSQVVCGGGNTYVLTKNGDLFVTGYEAGLTYRSFQKHDSTEKIIDIKGNGNSVFALSQDGEVYEFGFDSLWLRGGVFKKVGELQDLISIDVAFSNAAGLGRNGDLYCWGRDIYKRNTTEYMEPRKIGDIRDAEEVFCTKDYIYAIRKDTILCVPLNRRNRLLQWIDRHNIFYSGDK